MIHETAEKEINKRFYAHFAILHNKKARQDLQKVIRIVKSDYRDKVDSSYHRFDFKCMRNGLFSKTLQREKNSDIDMLTSLVDELNTYCAHFELNNTYLAFFLWPRTAAH